MSSTRPEEVTDQLPQVVLSHSHIPDPKLSITLTHTGIKDLLGKMARGDLVRIEIWNATDKQGESASYHQRFTIIRSEEFTKLSKEIDEGKHNNERI